MATRDRRPSPASDAASGEPGTTSPSRARRLAFAALTVVLVVVVVEGFSYLALWAVEGRPTAPGTLGEQRRQVLAGDARGAEGVPGDGDVPAPGRNTPFRRQQVLHPFLGFVKDYTQHPKGGDPRFSRESQEHGFVHNRTPVFFEPSTERTVVAILGGSVAEQLGNFARRQLPGLFAGVERFRGTEVVVLNLASGGYKQPQQLMTLQYFLAQGAHFDVVVNLDGFNEVTLPVVMNYEQGVHPFFPRSWNLRVDELTPGLRRAMGEITYLGDLRRDWAALVEGAFWRHSATVALVWRAVDRWLAGRVGTRERQVIALASRGGGFQATGPSYRPASDEQLYGDLVALWRRSSLLMHHACVGEGIEYHHFLQPSQYVEGSKPLTAEERRSAFDPDHAFRPGVLAGYPLLRAGLDELDRRGVAVHDLTRVFAEDEETLYADDCCHLNRRGYRLLAERMVRRIADTPAVP